MKTRAFFAASLCCACAPDLTGDMSLVYQPETSILEVRFGAHDGHDFERGTVFVELLANGADVSRAGTGERRACLDVPPTGELDVLLRDVEWNASITAVIWQDKPAKAKDLPVGAPEPEPRPCAGNAIVSEAWANDGEPLGRLEHPSWVTFCEGQDSAEVALRNVGDGDLVLKSIDIVPAEMGTLSSNTMPRVLAANESIVVSVMPELSNTAMGMLEIVTDDPVSRMVNLPITVGRPRLAIDRRTAQLGPDARDVRVDIINQGCGSLGDVDVALSAVDLMDEPVLEDVSIVGCGHDCTLPNPNSITLHYEGSRQIERSLLELSLTRVLDDSTREGLTVVVDDDCAPPIPMFTLSSTVACAGEVITLTSENEDMATYDWRILAGFEGATIEREDPEIAHFTATNAGLYVLGLDVVNRCGARSVTSRVAAVVVTQPCTE